MTRQKSVSLLAAVIVALVILALVGLAAPAYRSRHIRDNIAQALKAADAAKLAVMEAATVRSGLARIKAADVSGLSAPPADSHVAGLDIGDGGVIALRTQDTGAQPDPVFRLIPHSDRTTPGTIAWQCVTVVGDASYVPADCNRQNKTESAGLPAVPASAASTQP